MHPQNEKKKQKNRKKEKKICPESEDIIKYSNTRFGIIPIQ